MENTNNSILGTKNLYTYSYMDSDVIESADGMDIELREGSTPEIVGESGSDKSVVALSVMGLLMGAVRKVAEGEILFESRGLTKLGDEERRKMRGKKVSMIFQESMTSLNSVMKAESQIMECTLMYNSVSRQEARDKVVEVLKLTGVPKVEHMTKEYPFQLSGGQRQRVMIAMAPVCKPETLIAGEPTAVLDVTIQARALDLMENLKQRAGTSTLFITHDPGVMAEVYDDVIVMHSGRVVERGDVRSIFANPSHPYTRGLLTSIPELRKYAEELESIPDDVPNPKCMPQGCKFAPRCSCASDKCRKEEPGFYDVGGGHIGHCWLCEKKGDDVRQRISC